MASPSESEASATSKRILVTGGSGFIGSHTVVELIAAGYDVVIADNLVNSSMGCVARVRKLVGRDVPFQLVDLCNSDAVDLLFERMGPFHAVIHFAGLKAVGESVAIPLRYYQNNLIGTIHLLQAMEKHGCTNLVFSSSATVYAGAKNIVNPVTEDADLACTNAYGRTKLFIEDMLRDVCNGATGDQWRVVVLRYFNPVGAHESGTIGEDPLGAPNNLMPFVSQVAVGRRECVNVFGNDYDTPDGTGVRDYLHVVDLAKGHVAALQEGIDGDSMKTNCEAYNLGTGVGYSVLDMINAMSKACGHEVAHKMAARRPGDIATLYADASKAKKELKWSAKFDLDRMCEDQWRWQSQNPYGFKTKEEAEKAG